MMSAVRVPLLVVAVVVAATAPRASAAFGDFTYRTTITPAEISSPAGDMMLTMGGQSASSLNAASVGGAAAHAGGICLIGSSSASGAETISGQYTIDLFLTDTDSGQSGTLALTPPRGLLSQVTIPPAGDATAVTTSDLPPVESALIGSALYTVSASADFFIPPGAPLDKGRPGLTGGFVLHVVAAAVPEPAMTGLFCGIMIFLRRRRCRV